MTRRDTPSRVAASLLPRVWSRLPTAERIVYLTFDDGPSEATPGVLEILPEYDARASFFVLDDRAEQQPEIIHAMRRDGHTLGSHGREHTNPWRVRDPARWSGLGGEVRWLRPPFGHLTPALVRHAMRQDRHIALWDVMPGDFDPSLAPATVAHRVLNAIRPGSIVVLHDGPERGGRIEPLLLTLLPRLRDAGWKMMPLPDHPGREPYVGPAMTESASGTTLNEIGSSVSSSPSTLK